MKVSYFKMFNSRNEVQKIAIADFLTWSLEKQKQFVEQVNVYQLKHIHDDLLLKKFIVIKILVEARRATEEKSTLNLTAQFRNLCAYFAGSFFHIHADHKGLLDSTHHADDVNHLMGYRIAQLNDMGFDGWYYQSKALGVLFDEEYNLLTKTAIYNYHHGNYISSMCQIKWRQLKSDKTQLESVFALIKEETEYENTLGYDLFTFAAKLILADRLTESIRNREYLSTLIILTFTLVYSALFFLVIAPLSLSLIVMEYIVFNPIKEIAKLFETDEHQAFISQVVSEEDSSILEIRKNARVLAQGLRQHSIFSITSDDVISKIAGLTADPNIHNEIEADHIAMKYIHRP